MLVVEIQLPSCAIVAVGRGLATWWAGGNIISLPFFIFGSLRRRVPLGLPLRPRDTFGSFISFPGLAFCLFSHFPLFFGGETSAVLVFSYPLLLFSSISNLKIYCLFGVCLCISVSQGVIECVILIRETGASRLWTLSFGQNPNRLSAPRFLENHQPRDSLKIGVGWRL